MAWGEEVREAVVACTRNTHEELGLQKIEKLGKKQNRGKNIRVGKQVAMLARQLAKTLTPEAPHIGYGGKRGRGIHSGQIGR